MTDDCFVVVVGVVVVQTKIMRINTDLPGFSSILADSFTVM